MIYIVDKENEVKQKVKEVLKSTFSYNVCGELTDYHQMANEVPGNTKILIVSIKAFYADVVLNMVKRFNFKNSSTKVLGITDSSDAFCLTEIIGVGFSGVICKLKINEELELALPKLLNGGFYFSNNLKVR